MAEDSGRYLVGLGKRVHGRIVSGASDGSERLVVLPAGGRPGARHSKDFSAGIAAIGKCDQPRLIASGEKRSRVFLTVVLVASSRYNCGRGPARGFKSKP